MLDIALVGGAVVVIVGAVFPLRINGIERGTYES